MNTGNPQNSEHFEHTGVNWDIVGSDDIINEDAQDRDENNENIKVVPCLLQTSMVPCQSKGSLLGKHLKHKYGCEDVVGNPEEHLKVVTHVIMLHSHCEHIHDDDKSNENLEWLSKRECMHLETRFRILDQEIIFMKDGVILCCFDFSHFGLVFRSWIWLLTVLLKVINNDTNEHVD